MKILDQDFYLNDDVVSVARNLLGALLITSFDGQRTVGRIVETEAYAGIADRASHAFGGRRTARTEVMFGAGGRAYVYLCYGIHHLFNVVTGRVNHPCVVLIRALEPLSGLHTMANRSAKQTDDIRLGSGPGNLTRSMGIHVGHSGHSLLQEDFCIATDGFDPKDLISVSGRIGVDYAGPDAFLPYRFFIRQHPWVSRAKPSLNPNNNH